jgi:hypothetical protein
MFTTARRWLSKWFRSAFRRGTSAAARGRPDPFRPCLDPLEDRLVCDISASFPDLGDMINPGLAAHIANPGPDVILFTPLHVGDIPVMHIHPHVSININGNPVTIPAGIGILGVNGDMQIHTHDASGTLHVESILQHNFTLGDFFKIWGKPFTKNNILGHKTDAHHKITMTVNGVPSNAFQNLILTADEGIQTDSQGHITSNPPGIVINYVTIGGGTGSTHHAAHKK